MLIDLLFELCYVSFGFDHFDISRQAISRSAKSFEIVLNYFEEGYFSVLSIAVLFDVRLHHSTLRTCCLSAEGYVILSDCHQNHLQMKAELFAISFSSLTKVTIPFLICFCLACSFLTKKAYLFVFWLYYLPSDCAILKQ